MKKLIFLILLVIPFISRSQTDSVLYFFGKILNEYRTQNGLNELVIDQNLRGFAESHVKYMSDNSILTHNNLNERREKFFPNQTVKFSDGLLYLPTENNAITSILLPYNRMKVQDPRVVKLVSKINIRHREDDLSFNLATTLFYQWMNSSNHDKVLKHPKATKFYLSYIIKSRNEEIFRDGLIFKINSEYCYSEYVTM
jgi:hypothetical protein